MKSLIFLYKAALIILLFGCNNRPADAVKDAKTENYQKIDSQVTALSTAATLPSKEDVDFIVNATSEGMLEIQLGELAQTNSNNQRVKNFGALMIRDHSEEGEKLKALAISQNITLPDDVGNRQKKVIDKFRKKNGAAFDEAYINLMVQDHKKDLRVFEKQATNGTNQAIKSFASGNLQMLATHLDSAISILKVVGKKMPTVPGPPFIN